MTTKPALQKMRIKTLHAEEKDRCAKDGTGINKWLQEN